jgi:hypothetical protein
MADQELLQAYKILDLPETATKEQVEDRYFLLLKKKRNGQPLDEEAITRAYKQISDHQLTLGALQYDQEHYAGSKSKKAIDDFWHKYKVHVLLSALAIVIAIVGVQSYLDKRAEQIALSKLPPSNVDVMFVGHYQQAEQADLGIPLLAYFPEWQRIKVFISYNPSEAKDQFDIAATQKNMLNLITEIPDIYITDKPNFEMLVNQGAFMKLDRWKDEFAADRVMQRQSQEDEQAHAYGIDISDLTLFRDMELFGTKEMVIAFRFDTDNTENALLFTKRLLGID